MVCRLTKSGVSLVVENDLSYAIAVTDIHKCHSAHLTGTLNPSGKRHFAAGVIEAEFSAGFGPIHILSFIT